MRQVLGSAQKQQRQKYQEIQNTYLQPQQNMKSLEGSPIKIINQRQLKLELHQENIQSKGKQIQNMQENNLVNTGLGNFDQDQCIISAMKTSTNFYQKKVQDDNQKSNFYNQIKPKVILMRNLQIRRINQSVLKEIQKLKGKKDLFITHNSSQMNKGNPNQRYLVKGKQNIYQDGEGKKAEKINSFQGENQASQMSPLKIFEQQQCIRSYLKQKIKDQKDSQKIDEKELKKWFFHQKLGQQDFQDQDFVKDIQDKRKINLNLKQRSQSLQQGSEELNLVNQSILSKKFLQNSSQKSEVKREDLREKKEEQKIQQRINKVSSKESNLEESEKSQKAKKNVCEWSDQNLIGETPNQDLRIQSFLTEKSPQKKQKIVQQQQYQIQQQFLMQQQIHSHPFGSARNPLEIQGRNGLHQGHFGGVSQRSGQKSPMMSLISAKKISHFDLRQSQFYKSKTNSRNPSLNQISSNICSANNFCQQNSNKTNQNLEISQIQDENNEIMIRIVSQSGVIKKQMEKEQKKEGTLENDQTDYNQLKDYYYSKYAKDQLYQDIIESKVATPSLNYSQQTQRTKKKLINFPSFEERQIDNDLNPWEGDQAEIQIMDNHLIQNSRKSPKRKKRANTLQEINLDDESGFFVQNDENQEDSLYLNNLAQIGQRSPSSFIDSTKPSQNKNKNENENENEE